ncbi:hypothetical protein NUSPORA_00052 [Nucleospora cyclopteri]
MKPLRRFLKKVFAIKSLFFIAFITSMYIAYNNLVIMRIIDTFNASNRSIIIEVKKLKNHDNLEEILCFTSNRRIEYKFTDSQMKNIPHVKLNEFLLCLLEETDINPCTLSINLNRGVMNVYLGSSEKTKVYTVKNEDRETIIINRPRDIFEFLNNKIYWNPKEINFNLNDLIKDMTVFLGTCVSFYFHEFDDNVIVAGSQFKRKVYHADIKKYLLGNANIIENDSSDDSKHIRGFTKKNSLYFFINNISFEMQFPIEFNCEILNRKHMITNKIQNDLFNLRTKHFYNTRLIDAFKGYIVDFQTSSYYRKLINSNFNNIGVAKSLNQFWSTFTVRKIQPIRDFSYKVPNKNRLSLDRMFADEI